MIKLPYALSFPWRFNIRSHFKLVPCAPPLTNLLSKQNAGFALAFKSVIKAVAEGDSKFLQSVMEPRLAKAVDEGLEVIRRRNNELRLINESEYATSYFYNERLFFGVDLRRDRNSKKLVKQNLAEMVDFPLWRENARVPSENVRIFSEQLIDIEPKIVLKVDVLYSSPVKLVLYDESGDCVRGQKSYMPETHKLRFESMQSYPSSILNAVKGAISMWQFARGAKCNLFESPDWIITDIDDYLEGNAFDSAN